MTTREDRWRAIEKVAKAIAGGTYASHIERGTVEIAFDDHRRLINALAQQAEPEDLPPSHTDLMVPPESLGNLPDTTPEEPLQQAEPEDAQYKEMVGAISDSPAGEIVRDMLRSEAEREDPTEPAEPEARVWIRGDDVGFSIEQQGFTVHTHDPEDGGDMREWYARMLVTALGKVADVKTEPVVEQAEPEESRGVEELAALLRSNVGTMESWSIESARWLLRREQGVARRAAEKAIELDHDALEDFNNGRRPMTPAEVLARAVQHATGAAGEVE